MIASFGSKATEDIYHGFDTKEARKIPQTCWISACRKLDILNSAAGLIDLKSPPGNRFHPLKGDLKGKYSISVNDQYRIIFVFKDGNAYEVEIIDYH